ncbi:MAG: hypothetical protein PVH25_06905 [Burkholderiales bacterium]|jgi:hypothetical protein
MKKIWLIATVAALCSAFMVPAAAADKLSGTWAGAWYRGMTSGTMVLQIEADGSGVIQMTNLDNFSEDEVTLQKTTKEDTSYSFRAPGLSAGVFVASAQLSEDGKVLDGKGKYEGFQIKFKLKRR